MWPATAVATAQLGSEINTAEAAAIAAFFQTLTGGRPSVGYSCAAAKYGGEAAAGVKMSLNTASGTRQPKP